jgi:hypothetical protein
MNKKRMISLFLVFSLVLLAGCSGGDSKKGKEEKRKEG